MTIAGMLRGKHPREQGLKLTSLPQRQITVRPLRGKHPREQGLKPRITGITKKATPASRKTSKRTRIETISDDPTRMKSRLRGKHPREQGLKLDPQTAWTYNDILRGKHPREQGLKQPPPPSSSSSSSSSRKTSKRTRIETRHFDPGTDINILRGKHPREQGLKHQTDGLYSKTDFFEENIQENKD